MSWSIVSLLVLNLVGLVVCTPLSAHKQIHGWWYHEGDGDWKVYIYFYSSLLERLRKSVCSSWACHGEYKSWLANDFKSPGSDHEVTPRLKKQLYRHWRRQSKVKQWIKSGPKKTA
jgi:hypothetical protein